MQRKGGDSTKISYKKLWKLLIDRDMNKTKLRNLTNISQSTMAKLSKDENVTTDILLRICTALKCDIGDITSAYDEENQE